jgi:hypothetical protein
MSSPVDAMTQIRDAASSGRRSALFRWMTRNFDGFAAALQDAGKPNWAALADKFSEMGLTDRQGKSPTPAGARLTWYKVRQARLNAAKRTTSIRSAAIFLPPAPVYQPDAIPTEPDALPADDGFVFKTVRLRNSG